MTRRRPGMAGLDPMTGPLVEDTTDLDRRLRAVIAYVTQAPWGGCAPSRAGMPRRSRASGRAGDTSPVVPGPSA